MQSFMIALLACSVTMSALALFYMAITPILKKRYSEKGRYYAWLIIVVGLIIPFRPQWSNAIVKIDVPSATTTAATSETPTVQTGSETFVTIPDIVNIVPGDSPALPPATSSVSWWQIAAAVWLAGVMAFLAYHAVKHYRFLKVAKRWSENVTDEKALALLQSLKSEMGISRKIGLFQNSDMGSPLMYGFVNPRITLPTADMADDELRFILKHELVHYKRKDLYYKLLVLIATAVHWFNPLVYLIARAINAQCELSCDVEIVRNTDADTRQQYSEAIIGVVKFHSKLNTALSTNFYGGKKGMKNRISSIMDTRKKSMGMLIVCLALILSMGTGLVFAANPAYAAAQNSVIRDRIENQIGKELTDRLFNSDTLKQADAFLGDNASQLLLGWYFNSMYALYGNDVVQKIVEVEDVVVQIEKIFVSLGESKGMEQLRLMDKSQRLLFFARYLDMYLRTQSKSNTQNEMKPTENNNPDRVINNGQIVPVIIPVQDGLGRELFNRMQPVSDELTALWDKDNPFAPIIISEPFVPDADFFDRFTLIRP